MEAVSESSRDRRRAAALIERAAASGPWVAVTGMFKDGEWPCVITAQGDPKDAQTWLMGAGHGSSEREANVTHAGSCASRRRPGRR